MANDVVFTPVRELGELVRTKQLSPVELAEVFLERLETHGLEDNAVVTITGERAKEQARRAETEIASGTYRGPLHGIPYGLKDLFATSGGIPTTWGAAPFRHQTFDYDATVVRKLEEAGAVLVAKLAMVELAGGMGYKQPRASFTGPGINPWDRGTWSGGSSSGSGSAVAAGLVPFAIGSETWGSILSPAANCGVAGLRPTYGGVSKYGAMALSWTLDKPGPLCLTADDCGIVLEAISGPDPNDQTTVEVAYHYEPEDRPATRKLRLAVLKGATDEAEPAVAANFDQAIGDLEGVADVEEVELPDLPYEAATRTILMAESAGAFDEFIESGRASELTAPEDHYGPYARTTILATDYIKALRIRGVAAKALDEALAPFDALAALRQPTVARPLDQEHRGAFRGKGKDPMGASGNLAGLPAISVLSGFSEEGLPTSIQFMGRAYGEDGILDVARTYQTLTGWHQRHPPDLVAGLEGL